MALNGVNIRNEPGPVSSGLAIKGLSGFANHHPTDNFSRWRVEKVWPLRPSYVVRMGLWLVMALQCTGPLRLCLMRVSGHQSSPHQRIIVSTKYDPAQANCLRPAQPRLGDQEPPRPLSFPPMGAETNFLIFLFTAALLNHGRLNNNFQTG